MCKEADETTGQSTRSTYIFSYRRYLSFSSLSSLSLFLVQEQLYCPCCSGKRDLNWFDRLFFCLQFTQEKRYNKIFMTAAHWHEIKSNISLSSSSSPSGSPKSNVACTLPFSLFCQSTRSFIDILDLSICNTIKMLPISQSYKWVRLTRDSKEKRCLEERVQRQRSFAGRTSLNVMFDADN